MSRAADPTPFARAAGAFFALSVADLEASVIVEDLEAALSVLRSREVAIAYGPYAATPTQRSNAIIQTAHCPPRGQLAGRNLPDLLV